LNIPPTGRRISIRGVARLTVKSGRITLRTYMCDVAEFFTGDQALARTIADEREEKVR
jgi:hypothetical protein